MVVEMPGVARAVRIAMEFCHARFTQLYVGMSNRREPRTGGFRYGQAGPQCVVAARSNQGVDVMSSRKLIVVALALGGVLSAGLAQARGEANVQWSVTIGTPVAVSVAVPVYAPVYAPAYAPVPVIAPVRVYQPVPVYEPVQVYTRPAPVFHGRPYQHATYWDRDGDGIPDRYDRVYNPRWDRDGDGIPNRYDRVYNPPWDRDGDGVPNRVDRDGRRGHHEIDRVERDNGRIGRGSGR
jgi:hypothetical protein